MPNHYPTFLRITLAGLTALLVFLSPVRTHAQSIVGATCVPGNYYGPYNISGVTWSTADKWCVTNGTLMQTTNTCMANQGSPTIGVAWNNGATTGTISYYHPATATSPIATLTVNMITSGGISGGNPFVPYNTPVNVTINNAAPAVGCGGYGIGYQWQQQVAPNGTWTDVSGQNSASLTMTNTSFTQSMNFRRGAFFLGGPQGMVYTGTWPVITPNAGTISPATQTINGNATSAVLAVNGAGGCNGQITFTWYGSPDGLSWGAPLASSQSYTPPTPTVPVYYYRAACNCAALNSTVFTGAAVLNVLLPLISGTISPASQNINPNSRPRALTSTTPTGGNNNYTYQWLISPTGTAGSFQPVTNGSGSNTLTYSPGVMTGSAYYALATTSNSSTVISTSVYVNASSTTVYGVGLPNNPAGTPDNNMNWVISKAFDDNGNAISEGKKFYDNNGQLLQSQSKTFYRADANTVFTHVLASQSMADAYGRYVATSMSAPIDYADFSYRPNFILAPDGSNYTYKNFDRYNPISGSPTDKTDGSPSIPNSGPDPIGGQSTRGTLGWYFSTSNYWEPYTPTSTYPYSRQTFYRDGTGNVKKQGGEGETFKLASTHEASSYIVPVSGELQNYLAVRNQVFPSSQMGTMASSLLNNASMTISRDANGQEVVSISDRAGNVLMTARPGTGLIASNTASIVAIPTGYTQQVTCVTGTNVQLQTLTGGNNLVIYGVGASGTISSIYSGAATGAPLTIMGNGSFILLSDLPFSITYLSSAVSYSTGSEAYAGSRLPSFSYFRILADNTPVTITGSFSLEDMNSETFTSLPGGTTLNRGYYKITAITGIVNLSYNNGFMDVSYGFYDQKGQLVATVPPNGTKQLFGTGYMAFSTPASIPFVSLFSYDSQGRIIGNTTPDGGTSNMIYRLDGKIRFSQNALQTATGSFSYTDFDALGRPVESGQYRPLTGGVTYNGPAMTGLLGYTGINGSNDGLTNGVKTDVIMTTYDVPDNTHNQPGYAQVEANLGGAVSTSKKYRTITNNTPLTTDLVSQTWYNYDEEGRVVWTIKYIADLGSAGYKTTENTYDALGRLTKKIYQRCTGCNDMFVHYFQYDPANGNLWKVYTATADVGIPPTGSATLQATYIYYLNGGLKRVELGTNLQGIDYVYTLRGDLKSINNSNAGASADPGGDATTSNGFQPDVFGEVLDYFPNDYANGRSGIASINGVNTSAIVPTESYAGNIKAMTWYSTKPPGLGGSNSPTTYVFNYDPKYQFIAGTYGTGLNFGAAPATFTATSRNKETVVVPGSGTPGIPAYDNNGNILNLQRTDDGGVTTDQLAYSYTANTNKLATVTNTGSLGGAYSYSYDALGRQTSETNGAAPAKYIRYDIYGRPTLVALDAGFIHPLVGFVYDETGRRIEKIVYTADQISMITYYYSEAIYTQTVTNGVYGTLTPREFEVPGAQGRLGIYKPGGTYLYEITDHLGTVRAILTSSGSTQTTSEYYPFGLAFGGMGPGYRYGYQGQSSEADGETGWNSFNLRMYNPRIARWLTTDPKGQYFSTYEGMGNDPVKNKDADGGSTDDGGDFSEDFDMFDGGEAWNDIVLQDKAGNVLFVLKDNKNPCILQWEGTADLYKQAIQWFEPLADNYMPVAWLNPEIGKISTLKHFSWDDVAKFAEVNRSMWNYKQGWSGDWKKVQADGYYMSTIDGYPYWSDAIGQIPFAVDYFTDVFKGNSNDAIAETIEKGRAHGDGGAIFATAENGNIYDIYFVLRGALYASHRYTVTLEKTLLGPSWVLHPQPYAPSNMGSPISPGQAQMFLK